MREKLIEHARHNVWSSPAKDYTSVIQPARLSTRAGALGTIRVLWNDISLPTTNHFYHVFQIGNVNPKELANLDLKRAWVYTPWHNVLGLINDNEIYIEVYLDSGRVYPRMDCYLRYDYYDNLLLAVRKRNQIPEISNESVYVRFMSVSYFHSSQFAQSRSTYCKARHISESSVRATMITSFNQYKSRPEGDVLAYVNGIYVDRITNETVQIGDLVEFLYDPSIKRIESRVFQELPDFYSLADQRQKYLYKQYGAQADALDHPANGQVIITEPSGNAVIGFPLHRNLARNIKLITPQDLAIDVGALQSLIERAQSDGYLINTDVLTVHFISRYSGRDIEPFYSADRHHELTVLAPEQAENVLAANSPSLGSLTATELTQSTYMDLLQRRQFNASGAEVEIAYGYNATSLALGRSYHDTQAKSTLNIPVAYQSNSTVFEYNSNGALTDYRAIDHAYQIALEGNDTQHAEILGAKASSGLDITFIDLRHQNSATVSINAQQNYRLYRCVLIGDTPDWNWEDVSDQTQFDYQSETVTLPNGPGEPFYFALLSDKLAIVCERSVSFNQGVIEFTLLNDEEHPQTIHDDRLESYLTLPIRTLEIFIEGRALIPGVDYFTDGPRIVIANKEYLENASEPWHVLVRAHGLSGGDQYSTLRDHGFIENAQLGDPSGYQVQQDLNVVYFIDGCITPKESIEFAGIPRVNDDRFDNGRPYMIREHIVNLQNTFSQRTYPWRAQAREHDERISNLISAYLDPDAYPQPQYVKELYWLYSPFCGRIIDALQNGVFDSDLIAKQVRSSNEIHIASEPYSDYLNFDPAYQGFDQTHANVHVHPYYEPMSLSAQQYLFLRDIIMHWFGEDVIDLTGMIEVYVEGKGEIDTGNLVGTES